MQRIFDDCMALIDLDNCDFDSTHAENVLNMFYCCSDALVNEIKMKYTYFPNEVFFAH